MKRSLLVVLGDVIQFNMPEPSLPFLLSQTPRGLLRIAVYGNVNLDKVLNFLHVFF